MPLLRGRLEIQLGRGPEQNIGRENALNMLNIDVSLSEKIVANEEAVDACLLAVHHRVAVLTRQTIESAHTRAIVRAHVVPIDHAVQLDGRHTRSFPIHFVHDEFGMYFSSQ